MFERSQTTKHKITNASNMYLQRENLNGGVVKSHDMGLWETCHIVHVQFISIREPPNTTPLYVSARTKHQTLYRCRFERSRNTKHYACASLSFHEQPNTTFMQVWALANHQTEHLCMFKRLPAWLFLVHLRCFVVFANSTLQTESWQRTIPNELIPQMNFDLFCFCE